MIRRYVSRLLGPLAQEPFVFAPAHGARLEGGLQVQEEGQQDRCEALGGVSFPVGSRSTAREPTPVGTVTPSWIFPR